MARISANGTFARRLDAAGWALFFIWTGVALLAGVGWSWALIGTAVIILAVQAILLFRGEPVDIFMAAVGMVLLGGSVADLYGLPWSFLPAALIVVGVAILGGALRGGGPQSRPEAGRLAGRGPGCQPRR